MKEARSPTLFTSHFVAKEARQSRTSHCCKSSWVKEARRSFTPDNVAYHLGELLSPMVAKPAGFKTPGLVSHAIICCNSSCVKDLGEETLASFTSLTCVSAQISLAKWWRHGNATFLHSTLAQSPTETLLNGDLRQASCHVSPAQQP